MNRKQRRAQAKGTRPPAPSPPTAADPVALHQAGVEAYRAGQLAAAAALIAQAIAANAAVPEFHYNLAIVLRALNRLEEAAASYERAIALKPDHVNAHNNLGNVWKALGRSDKARASFTQALHHNPANADTHYSLGILCCDLGEAGEAERHFRRCLECDPDDRWGAAIMLAHLGVAGAPERTPQAQLLSLYDVRARFWDEERGYFAPALVAEALRRHAPRDKLDILDIGCGTGQLGPLVRDLAGRLDGVDLSPAMLEKAKSKSVYDGLFEEDLTAFMAAHKHGYDAILAAATLIHLGDLTALFQAASCCLRKQGLFVFTFFPAAEDGSPSAADYAAASNLRLAQSGCFAHGPAYVERLALQTGLAVLQLETITHEHDQDNKPVAGLLAVLLKS